MSESKRTRKTSDGRRILDRITGEDARLRAAIANQKLNVQVAEMILAARERAGLTQTQLAGQVGTTQSVISRLEDADYDGRSLTLLQRIAAALDMTIQLRMVPTAAVSR